ncbi:hypothetical protein [Haloplasma contractile]|nr:hypothetical protein [Haloplasma contractile]
MNSNKQNEPEKQEERNDERNTVKQKERPLNQLVYSLVKEQESLTRLLETEVGKNFHCLRYHDNFNELLAISEKIEETMKLIIKKEEIINKILKTIAILNAQTYDEK